MLKRIVHLSIHAARRLISGGMPLQYYKLLSHFLIRSKMRRIARYHHRPDVRKLFLQRTSVEIDDGTYVNYNVSVLDGMGSKLKIGKRVAISPGVTFICYSAPNDSELNNNLYVKQHLVQKGEILVEDDVWIGASAIILPNVRIGKKSIIGAGAVVCNDVPPYSIVAGIPAKIVRNISEYEPDSQNHELCG
ncbi:acyltransferase [Candidatus Poribacteria bacterium]